MIPSGKRAGSGNDPGTGSSGSPTRRPLGPSSCSRSRRRPRGKRGSNANSRPPRGRRRSTRPTARTPNTTRSGGRFELTQTPVRCMNVRLPAQLSSLVDPRPVFLGSTTALPRLAPAGAPANLGRLADLDSTHSLRDWGADSLQMCCTSPCTPSTVHSESTIHMPCPAMRVVPVQAESGLSTGCHQ